MPNEQRHTIRQQLLTIDLPPPADTTALQAWSEWSGTALPRILQRVFDAHTDADTHIALDQLVVNLELPPGTPVLEAMQAALPQALERALQEALATAGIRRSEDAQHLHWLKTYLAQGSLPWSAPRLPDAPIWAQRLLRALAAHPEAAAELLVLLMADAGALERLLRAFPPELAWQLLATVRPGVARQWLPAHRARLGRLVHTAQLAAWQRILATTAAGQRLPIPPAEILAAATERATKPAKVQEQAADTAPDATPDTLYVADAGLVLLAPFVPQLLATLLGEPLGTNPLPPAAVHILHYLVHGRAPTAEWELALPKLLCGWPIGKTVPMDAALPTGTETECHQLLEAVVRYWAVLKNTSVDGLRTAFLQRTGRLSHTDDHWQLNVEQQAHDLLIDRLPWAYSHIKLPWMPAHLNVVWT